MLSSSRVGDEAYLKSASVFIDEHLGDVKDVLFIPFAGVTLNWDDYTKKVQDALPSLTIHPIHRQPDMQVAIKQAKAIMVGGGNTFNLLHHLYHHNLLALIKSKVTQGSPYVGWSAGANICGGSICTTNDMPIVQPKSFIALSMVPFQINPHYSDYQPPGFNGETRAQRIKEFCVLNPNMPVIGIREGSALLLRREHLTLIGDQDGVMFSGQHVQTICPQDDLTHLLDL